MKFRLRLTNNSNKNNNYKTMLKILKKYGSKMNVSSWTNCEYVSILEGEVKQEKLKEFINYSEEETIKNGLFMDLWTEEETIGVISPLFE